jgi:hypothetical protein
LWAGEAGCEFGRKASIPTTKVRRTPAFLTENHAVAENFPIERQRFDKPLCAGSIPSQSTIKHRKLCGE